MSPASDKGLGKAREPPRIGVFICHCGVNIGGFVDVPDVVEYAGAMDGVVHAEGNLYTCAEDGLQSIKNAIKEHGLNRVIVASCTPRTHEPLFRSACVDAGLNKFLFEMVNIREQCSWVHMDDKRAATDKAKELVRMAVARSKLLEPLDEGTVPVTPTVLVIGGGIAGMSAALSIADQGFKVYLVEKEESLGGLVRGWGTIGPGERDPKEIIGHLESGLRANEDAEVLTSSEVTEISGYVGNFEVKVRTPSGERSFKVGSVIVATGGVPLVPAGLYGHGQLPNVLTMEEFERGKGPGPGGLRDVVIVQCVGSRGEKVSYCSRICCSVAIKNALLLKGRDPKINVTILHRDIMAYGIENEEQYVEARSKGVNFVRYSRDRRPEVTEIPGRLLSVGVWNEAFGRLEALRADMVLLSTPIVANDGSKALAQMLKVPLGQEGFFFEAHVKLRPVDFATDGIFLAGTCRAPCSVSEAVTQGRAVASRATIALSQGKVLAGGAIAKVDPDICWGCGLCVEVCPYGAPVLVERDGRRFSEINEVLCKACGVCVVNCPVMAITARHFTHEQIISMIEALGTGGGAHGR
jgi:heterodisulfide reductase subunit A